MVEKKFTINSRKFDGSLHRTWQAELIEETKDYWLFVGTFSENVNHSKIGIIRRDTVSYEFFWKNRYYNIFRFHEPEGNFKLFYCNVCLKPQISKNVLDYVDLDVDIIVDENFSFKILDEDEFEVNAVQFGYPKSIRLLVQNQIDELKKLISSHIFPFDYLK